MLNNFSIKSFFVFCAISISNISFSQNQMISDLQLIELFKEIHESDGSNLNHPKIREQIFYKNFDTIIWVIKNQGYPVLSEKKHKKKDINYIDRSTIMTFTHILQTDPIRLLNPKMIALIEQEVANNRISPSLLKIALSVFQYDQDFQLKNAPICNEVILDNFYLAIRKWNIKLYTEKD